MLQNRDRACPERGASCQQSFAPLSEQPLIFEFGLHSFEYFHNPSRILESQSVLSQPADAEME